MYDLLFSLLIKFEFSLAWAAKENTKMLRNKGLLSYIAFIKAYINRYTEKAGLNFFSYTANLGVQIHSEKNEFTHSDFTCGPAAK